MSITSRNTDRPNGCLRHPRKIRLNPSLPRFLPAPSPIKAPPLHMRNGENKRAVPFSFPKKNEAKERFHSSGSCLVSGSCPPPLKRTPGQPPRQLMIFYWFVGDGRFLKGGGVHAELPSPSNVRTFRQRQDGWAVH